MGDRIVNGRRRSDNELLDTALRDFYGAADEMHLNEGLISMLSYPERRVDVSVPVLPNVPVPKTAIARNTALHRISTGPIRGISGRPFHRNTMR